MTHARVEDRKVSRYPYSFAAMQLDNPNVSFDAADPNEQAVAYGRYPVIDVPPSYDASRQVLGVAALEDWPVNENSVTVLYTLTDRAVETRKAEMVERLKEKRWLVETAGVSVEIDSTLVPVSTMRGDDRTALHMEFTRLAAGIRPDGATFNFADGQPRSISNAIMMAAIQTALNYVQAAFDRQAAVTSLIDAAETHDALDLVEAEIYSGWLG